MKKRILLSAVAILFLSCAALQAAKPARHIAGLPQYLDEVNIYYKTEFSQADIDAFAAKYSLSGPTRDSIINFIESHYSLTRTRKYLENVPFTVYKIPDINKMAEITAALKAETVIQAAEPNYLKYALTVYYPPVAGGPSDSAYNLDTASISKPAGLLNEEWNQWGFWQVRADKAFAAGLLTSADANDVVVAVLDTGVGYDSGSLHGHPDLVGVTLTGKNIINPSILPYDDDTGGGHGTHCAGLIAANTNDNYGIAGISLCNTTWAKRVKILPVKVLDQDGSGSDADIYSGLVWAADNGANIISMSFGGSTADTTLHNGINYAASKGCLLIAAAGNDSSYTGYPASYSNVMAVSAVSVTADALGRTTDVLADFSSYGKVDVCAPGVDILSSSNLLDPTFVYSSWSGTSFSCPITAGIAAAILCKNPGYTALQLRDQIEQTADDAGASGYDTSYGWGRVNLYRALTNNRNTVTATNIKTYNWPNPFSPERDVNTVITFIVENSTALTIEIYDGGGELVIRKQIPASQVQANAYNSCAWNGKNSEGKLVGSGTYFYIVKTPSGKYGKNKIAVLY